MQRHAIRIGPDQDGERLDRAVAALLPELSRRRIRRAIDGGGAYLNGRRVRQLSRVVRVGDAVELVVGDGAGAWRPVVLGPERVLYEDGDCIAIDKPPGLPSQPTEDQAVVHAAAAVAALLAERGERWPELRVVHRLDAGTSGVLLLGKTRDRARRLIDQFRRGAVEKRYLARCRGTPPAGDFEVACRLSRIDRRTRRVRVVDDGASSRTSVRVVARSDDGTVLVECTPHTGRTHQLRVHLAHVGLPIVGDRKYGGRRAGDPDRPLLHAQRLAFARSDGERIAVEAPLPADFG